ncbi:MAG TPA: radical SAM protein [Myxococcota bacterium]|nr:radical SAM protein [Myxococcota bacterium]
MRVHLLDVAPRPGFKQHIPTLTLPRVAGCTPAGVDVAITDGRVEPIPSRIEADLVGMTFNCNNAPHAYRLARDLRDRGVTVIAGGTHATAIPDEVLEHFDALLTGEAEGGAWAELLGDFAAGRMKERYSNPGPPSLAGLRPPRLDLLSRRHWYIDFAPIEATRGCTHDCSFCFNSTIHGAGFRTRPVEEVVEDARRARSRRLMFMDDNLCGKPGYAKELLEALIPLKKQLFFQTHMLMAADDELLRLAALAGTRAVFVGIESFHSDSLSSVNKGWNRIRDYRRYMDAFHAHDIFVSGGLILGLDHDTPDIFDQTLAGLNAIGLDSAAINLVIPYPGTDDFRRYDAEGRILHRDWTRYDGENLVVRPALMSPEKLFEGYHHVIREFYRPRSYLRRMRWSGMPSRWYLYAVAWLREPRLRIVRRGLP